MSRPAPHDPGIEPLEVSLNGKPQRLAQGATISSVVAGLGAPATGLAVALNEEVVPRSRWGLTLVANHDRIEVLAPAQGG